MYIYTDICVYIYVYMYTYNFAHTFESTEIAPIQDELKPSSYFW